MPVLGMQGLSGISISSRKSYRGSFVTVTAPGMSQRFAAQAVIEELVGDSTHVVPRNRVARILGRSPLSSSGIPWYLGAQGDRKSVV